MQDDKPQTNTRIVKPHLKEESETGIKLKYSIKRSEKNETVDIEVKLKDGSLFLESHKDIKEFEILKLHGPVEIDSLFDD